MLVAFLTLGLACIATPTFAAKEVVTICHIPPDNPDNVQTIGVTAKAAASHISEHGDFEVGIECYEGVGECEVVGETVCAPGVDVCTASPLFPPPEPTEVSCADGLDNDCDGQTDLDDSDCTPSCVPNGEYCNLNNPGACCSKACLSTSGGLDGVCF